jgi:hypothetical protein
VGSGSDAAQTTIVTLVAVLTVGFASAPITPAASASKNNGRYKRSGEAKRKEIQCGFQKSVDLANIEATLTAQQWADGARAAGNVDEANLSTKRLWRRPAPRTRSRRTPEGWDAVGRRPSRLATEDPRTSRAPAYAGAVRFSNARHSR